eukprot:9646971-Ditylum_brightwellii.AAC.1
MVSLKLRKHLAASILTCGQCANTCLPFKVVCMCHICALCCLLKKICGAKKTDKHIYHSVYMLIKGNQFKNKHVLLETIYTMKAEKAKKKALAKQSE